MKPSALPGGGGADEALLGKVMSLVIELRAEARKLKEADVSVIATRYNARLQQVHRTLIAAGKPWKVAITAVMRRLISSPTP